MTTKQTAQQLELAAQILRTGHPWEFKGIEEWHSFGKYPRARPEACIFHGQEIRLILATPPDNRPLHNPDNLTAEQVGAGWRLTLKGEPTNLQIEQQEFRSGMEWRKSGTVYTPTFDAAQNSQRTYRLPLSVPWPEAEKKTVPLGPDDVQPFTVIRRKGEAETWHWRTVSYVDAVKVTCGNRGYGWEELASDYERNISLPLTGKWNPDAWEPCHKPSPNLGKNP